MKKLDRISPLSVLLIIFIYLKVTDQTDLSWAQVFVPFYLSILAAGILEFAKRYEKQVRKAKKARKAAARLPVDPPEAR